MFSFFRKTTDGAGDTEDGARLLNEEPDNSGEKCWGMTRARHTYLDASQSCRKHAVYFLYFLIPSFLIGNEAKPSSTNAIASLDGLRGYASLGVFTLHFTDTFCQMHNRGWGFDENSHYPIQLPFIHYFWSANSLVATFFVISGYVLSHKPLRLIHAPADEQFLATMRSAIFRRGLRLYIPIGVATMISMLMLRVGVFDYPHWVFQNGFSASAEDTPFKLDSFGAQLRDWWAAQLDIMYLFRWGGGAAGYDPHLWTIPTEFQGSMLLFFTTVGVSQLRHGARLGLITALAAYCIWYDQNDLLRFFVGMLLADVDLLLRALPAERRTHVFARLRWPWLACFVVGGYLVGMPSWDPQATPGYVTLMWIMPSWVHWQTLGCTLLVWAVRNSKDVRRGFDNPFARYLGNVSFSLYIVHGNVRRTVSYALIPVLLEWTNGKESVTGYRVMVAVNAVVTYTVVFYLADLWWRAVDLPSIRFARWLERILSRKED